MRVKLFLATDETRIKTDSINEPLELHLGAAEVDEQANLYARGLELVQQSGLVRGLILLGDLELDDHLVFHQEIGLVVTNDDPLVPHLDVTLGLGLQLSADQLDLHRPLIHLFEKPIPKHGMNLESRTNDLLRNLSGFKNHDLTLLSMETLPRAVHACRLIRVSSVFHPWLNNP